VQALLCLLLFLLLGCQDGLQHIARLGDVREIDLGRDRLCCARGRGSGLSARARSTLVVRANLLRLVLLERTRVGLAARQAELRQYVENLPALDFHLAREIVDTNLTHPPLFNICYPTPLVAHNYLAAMAARQNSVVACPALFALFKVAEVVANGHADALQRLFADAGNLFQLLGRHVGQRLDGGDARGHQLLDNAVAQLGNLLDRRRGPPEKPASAAPLPGASLPRS
jgi:hypothetical protein